MMSWGTQRPNAPREEHPFGQVHQNAWHNRKGSSQSLGSLALSLHQPHRQHSENCRMMGAALALLRKPRSLDRWINKIPNKGHEILVQ